MAARKLKFKPKPLIGGALRRPREKEESLVLTNQDLNLKQGLSPCDITSPTNAKEDERPLGDEQDISGKNDSKRMKLEQSEKISKYPLNNLNETSEPSCSTASNPVVRSTEEEMALSTTSSDIAEKAIYKNVCEIKSMESDSTQSNECCANTSGYSLSSQECTVESQSDKTCVGINTDLELNLKQSQESTATKSNLKTGASKEISRFVRSKFKPVLNNNNVLRKKTEIDDLNGNKKSEICPIAIVRKESVINNVAEKNKSSIVSEITESFTALESEEIPLGSQTKDNELFNSTSRISIAVDIESNMSKTDGNKKDYIVNTVNVTESHGIDSETSKSILMNGIDSEHSNRPLVGSSNCSEIPHSNISTLATKVPVSPLKFTSKILAPKPCPNLLDTTARRISFHGSDSEEEPKCKIFLGNNKLGKKSKKEKDTKNNKRKVSQGSTYSKLGQEALEKFTQKFGKTKDLEPPDKAKLTMLDLIFYNPKTNPMSGSNEPSVCKNDDKCEINEVLKETLAEQRVDDVDEVETPGPAVPVPQLKVGPDGQIMLDPKSLIIETTEVKEKRAVMEKSGVIRETGITRYNTYSKKKHSRKDWSAQETLQFYKALNTIGTDFTLMTKLFPNRSRHELKLKFKKEERTNLNLVDKAMTAPTDFDFSSLEQEMKLENEEIALLQEKKKLAAEEARKKRAQRKEVKEKMKGKVPKYSNSMRIKDAAFKNFDEVEIEKIKIHPSSKKRNKKSVKKKQSSMLIASSSEEEQLPINIDLDSDEADLEENELKLLRMIKEKTRSGSRRNLRRKQTKNLEEYEEINQTLKRKLEEIDSDSSDGYTPNGLDTDVLFGSPLKDPFSENESQKGEEKQWSMEITTEPRVDSEIINSHQDPLGDSVDSSDLSLPASKVSKVPTDSVLNRHLISESIQIVDQLTSTINININFDGSVASYKQNEDVDISENFSEQEPSEKCVLPCSVSAGDSHLSKVNSVQNPDVKCDETITIVNDGDNPPEVSNKCPVVEGNNEQGTVFSHYGKHSEECILGE